MTHGSLFSGIGGFDLAAEWMGWHNVFHCEWMPFPRKVLSHYWPQAISYHDITTTDFRQHEGSIDILTGGFPCQPYSAAGKRKGKDDDRHLWPHMLRCIREVKPRWVVGENVFGLATWNGGLVFEEVCAELEAEGYAVQPFVLPAAAVNAPHRRDRVWFVANATYCGCRGGNCQRCANGRKRIFQDECTGGKMGSQIEGCCRKWTATDAESVGSRKFASENCGREDRRSNDACETWDATDSNGHRLEGCLSANIPTQQRSTEINASECISTHKDVLSFENFPTQSPICGGDDGLPAELDGITFPKWRAESIKGYGNAIVPQVALQIFKAIEKYELITTSEVNK